MGIIMIHDIKGPLGQTYRAANLEKKHAIPLGSLVEVRLSGEASGGASWVTHARLWVVSHDRDCDGTPLYSLGRQAGMPNGRHVEMGIAEQYITVVEVTPAILDGYDTLAPD